MRDLFQSGSLAMGVTAMAVTLYGTSAHGAGPDEPAVTAGSVIIENPRWARPPVPEFPAVGLSLDSDGSVTIRCGFQENGALKDCVIELETPVDAGFGPTALAATANARLSTSTIAGSNPDTQVRFLIRFRIAR